LNVRTPEEALGQLQVVEVFYSGDRGGEIGKDKSLLLNLELHV
jgi:hypothetical protein